MERDQRGSRRLRETYHYCLQPPPLMHTPPENNTWTLHISTRGPPSTQPIIGASSQSAITSLDKPPVRLMTRTCWVCHLVLSPSATQGVKPPVILWKSRHSSAGPGSSRTDRREGVTLSKTSMMTSFGLPAGRVSAAPAAHQVLTILFDDRDDTRPPAHPPTIYPSFLYRLPPSYCRCSFWATSPLSRPLSLPCLPW